MALLEVRDVHYEYVNGKNVTKALRGVNLSLEKGKTYAVTGRSGCGKTTLLSLIAGFDKPSSGQILFDGEPINNANSFRRDNVGMVFQSYNLIKHLTVLENILIATEISSVPRCERKKRACEAVKMVGLTEKHLKKRPGQLSGGEQQRVAVARVIACSPKIILADEPTGNLDNANSDVVVSLLCDMAKNDGKCVVIVTHSEEIAQRADVRIRMADGKNCD